MSSTSRSCMEQASWSGSAVHVGKGDVGRQRLAGGPWYDDATPPSSFTGECATEKREKGERKRRNNRWFYLRWSAAGAGLRTVVADLGQ